MKRSRLLLLAVGALALLGLVAVAVVASPGFQTWAVRKALARQPDLHASVGRVDIGTHHALVTDLRLNQEGLGLVVPALDVELSVLSAVWQKQVLITKLVARGWKLDLARATTPTGAVAATTSASPSGTAPAAAAAQAFAGVFGRLRLPIDLSLDGVELEGDVVLPAARGQVRIGLKGGGLGATREGSFGLEAAATLADPNVNAVTLRGTLSAKMDTPRTLERLQANLDAAARGAKFPQGVSLTARLAAAREAAGEKYSIGVVTEGREILAVQAEFPSAAQRLQGTWKIDVHDANVAPFALGAPLPAFTAVGAGQFDTDAMFATLHALGRLDATTARLEVLKPELAALGELRIASDFDLAVRNGTLDVQRLEATVSGGEPIGNVRSLQAFEFNPRTGELRAADTARELFGIGLQGLPVGWAQPFLKDFGLTGGRVRGELAGTPRGGGVTLRSTAPVTIDDLSLRQGDKPIFEHVAFSLTASADYTPRGWQVEIDRLAATTGEAPLLSLNAKAGQLAGRDQPLKATGTLTAQLPGLLAQPLAAGRANLTAGEATVEFAASVDGKKELQAKIALRKLATRVNEESTALPVITANVRADIGRDGQVTFNAPLVLERNERKSDLTIAGTIAPEKDKVRALDAAITSTQLVVDDAEVLGAMFPTPPRDDKKADTSKAAGNAPPWAGLHGSLALQLKRVIYSDTFEATNVGGRLRIDAGTVKLEGVQAGFGAHGRASVNGTVTFNAASAQPYSLTADVAVKEFDPGPLFRAINGNQPPTVEGKFDISSKLSGRAATIGDLALGAGGDFQLTSRGGMFRGLPVNLGRLVEASGKTSTWAAAETVWNSITRKKEPADIPNKERAVAEFAKALCPLPYDQLSVVVSRDAALNTTLRDFTLIAPEMRLTGRGTALHKPGASLLDDQLAMEFKLRARGRQGELLKYLGALEPQPDEIGYAACTLPLKIGGTLGKPDTSELSARLVAIALEKSGVTDKAADFMNKLFGGGKKESLP